jgi:hypothetical protein
MDLEIFEPILLSSIKNGIYFPIFESSELIHLSKFQEYVS